MKNNDIIAKLIAQQVNLCLVDEHEAKITLLVKPTKKWVRGRLEEVRLLFRCAGRGAGINVSAYHIDYNGVTTFLEDETTDLKAKLLRLVQEVLSGFTVIDVKDDGLVFNRQSNRPAV